MANSIQEDHPLADRSRQSIDTTEKPSEVHGDESHFPTGPKLLMIVISILFAMFLVALVSIVSPIDSHFTEVYQKRD